MTFQQINNKKTVIPQEKLLNMFLFRDPSRDVIDVRKAFYQDQQGNKYFIFKIILKMCFDADLLHCGNKILNSDNIKLISLDNIV